MGFEMRTRAVLGKVTPGSPTDPSGSPTSGIKKPEHILKNSRNLEMIVIKSYLKVQKSRRGYSYVEQEHYIDDGVIVMVSSPYRAYKDSDVFEQGSSGLQDCWCFDLNTGHGSTTFWYPIRTLKPSAEDVCREYFNVCVNALIGKDSRP